MATRSEARQAKQSARAVMEALPGFTGLGLTKIGEGYAIRVNLETDAAVADVPAEFDGVPVDVEVVGRVQAH